jgi:hypothetical protein
MQSQAILQPNKNLLLSDIYPIEMAELLGY